MPHIPLRDLERELEEENATIEDKDIQAVADEGNNEVAVNNWENINAAENLPPNPKSSSFNSRRIRMHFGKMLKKLNSKSDDEKDTSCETNRIKIYSQNV